MSKESFLLEPEEAKFSNDDLSPFESLITGGSVEIKSNGNRISCMISNLEQLMKKRNTREQILSPISLTQGKRTLEEVNKARRIGKVFAGALLIFNDDVFYKFLSGDVLTNFKPGKLDENGQLDTFEVFFLKKDNNRKIKLSSSALKELSIDIDIDINKGFVNLVQYLGIKNGAMKFRVKSDKEIKGIASPRPRNT